MQYCVVKFVLPDVSKERIVFICTFQMGSTILLWTSNEAT